MPDRKFVAHCAACGHTYKVSSEEKTYPCKECGGEVHADLEPVLDEATDEYLPGHRSIRERHPHSGPKKGSGLALVALVVFGGLGILGYGLGWFGFLTGAEPDFDKVTMSFVEDWNASDVDALADDYNPSKQDEFRAKLERIRAGRGWESVLPSITGESHGLSKGTAEDPELAVIDFEFTGIGKGASSVPGWGQASWQFEPSLDRWFLFDLRLVPTPLAPRADGLLAAWNQSSMDALGPYFRPTSVAPMVEMVQKWGKRKGWLGAHPPVRSMSISGEEEARRQGVSLIDVPDVLSEGATAGDPLVAKWTFSPELDDWYVIGFKSFP